MRRKKMKKVNLRNGKNEGRKKRTKRERLNEEEKKRVKMNERK